jgi:hypothetical protein
LNAIQVAIQNWQREGVSLLAPLEVASITAAMEGVGRKYSSDVVGLYLITGGMKEGEEDARCFSLWSIDRLIAENSSYKRPHILFADFLIASHFYCFRYQSEQLSSVCVDFLNEQEPKIVAASVAEFFDLCVRDPGKLEMFD